MSNMERSLAAEECLEIEEGSVQGKNFFMIRGTGYFRDIGIQNPVV